MINKKVVRNENGEEVVIELLTTFKIEEKNKNYVVYTINDDESSDKVTILISEFIEDESGIKIVAIPDEEKELVINCYNDIKNSL